MSWTSWLASGRPHTPPKSRPLTRRARPAVEPLEDRLVLSADGLPGISGASFTPEGVSYTLQLDSAGRNVTQWTINWGDGATDTVAGTATSASHTYADGPNGYTISAKATEVSPLSLTQWNTASGGNGHYYTLTSGVQTWTQAEAEAAALGGHLVSITSAQEQAFVVNTFLSGVNDRRILWMGLNDAAAEGTFVWSSGEAVAYTNFQGGEPNNFKGVEDYGALNWHYGNMIGGGVKGSWNDTPNDGFIASATAPLLCVGVMEFNAAPGGPDTVRTLQVQVDNVAPTAGISGPSGGTEGQTLTYTLTASDPSAGDRAAGFTFALDWDGDGVVDQTVVGQSGVTVEHAFAQSGGYDVRVSAKDRDGDTGPQASLAVNVLNVAPTAGVSGPSNGVRGQTLSFTLTASDPSAGDQSAGFTFAIDWDGDGVTDQTVVGQSGVTVEHAFARSGTYNVRVTARDRDGGASVAAALPVKVSTAALQADPLDASKTVLVVGGTAGNDTIVFTPAGRHGEVRVSVNGRDEGVFKPTGGVVAYGYAGNDLLFASCYNGAARLFGGDGHDLLVAGGGDSILSGGDGDDVLLGGCGDDVLVGGAGNDVSSGGGGHDVLIGGAGRDLFIGCSRNDLVVTGATAFDDDLAALSAVRSEWSARRKLDVRLKNLKDGGGSADRLNGDVFLNAQTLLPDEVSDRVFAHKGHGNALFSSFEDRIPRGWRR